MMGSTRARSKVIRLPPGKQFKAFFCLMGEYYKQLIYEKEIDVYKIFRCGMANTYFAGDCDIKMFNDDYPTGIILKPDGKYIFSILEQSEQGKKKNHSSVIL